MSRIVVVDSLVFETHKTAEFNRFLKKLKLNNKKVTVIVGKMQDNIKRATSNLEKVFVVESNKASTYDLIDCEYILTDKESIEVFIKILS